MSITTSGSRSHTRRPKLPSCSSVARSADTSRTWFQAAWDW
jgi:hypothetical protein